MKAHYKSYPSNLTSAQWVLIALHLPGANSGGRSCKVNLRAVLDAIFYVLCEGCTWRMLPGDFPNWQTVYGYFRRWRQAGRWEPIYRYLGDWVRLGCNRSCSASVAIVDSQSVQIGCLSKCAFGFDGSKLTKGRKRHLLVSMLGLVMAVVVTPANISDQAGAKQLFAKVHQQRRWFRRLFLIYTDGTYRGKTFIRWAFGTDRWILETVPGSEQWRGFQLLPKRWIVERTFAWLQWKRRLSKYYKLLPETSEAFIYLAINHLMLRRLA